MVVGEHHRILEYLKKHGSANSFRVARKLGIKRHKLLNHVKELEKKGALEVRSGMIRFLKLPIKEKKLPKKRDIPTRSIKFSKIKNKSKSKTRTSPLKLIEGKLDILENVQAENRKFREKLLELERTINRIEQKVNIPPKIIRKTIVKKIIKKHKERKKPQKFRLPELKIGKKIKQLKKSIIQKKKNWKPKIDLSRYKSFLKSQKKRLTKLVKKNLNQKD